MNESRTDVTAMDVRYAANLARLELTDAEALEYQGQLSRVVDYFKELRQLELGSIEPTAHAAEIQNVFRDDVVTGSLNRETVLANAPVSSMDLFVVPKIVE